MYKYYEKPQKGLICNNRCPSNTARKKLIALLNGSSKKRTRCQKSISVKIKYMEEKIIFHSTMLFLPKSRSFLSCNEEPKPKGFLGNKQIIRYWNNLN
jgi:hypothetical protein